MGSVALLGLMVVLGMGLAAPAAGGSPAEGVSLFDGKDLERWHKPMGVHEDYFQHTAETTEDVPKEGRIGLQIHAGADWSEGSRVRFRNIRLTEL